MPRNNNPIPDTHHKKDLLQRIKVNFNQGAKKKTRQAKRALKAKILFPRPINNLKPIIRACSIKYNSKRRLGKGFSLEELKAVGIHKREARTIGIAVDHRRQNRNNNAFQNNVLRLKKYKRSLVLFPKHPYVAPKAPKEKKPKEEKKEEKPKAGEKKKATVGQKRKAPVRKTRTAAQIAKVVAKRVETNAKRAKLPSKKSVLAIGQRTGDIYPIRDRKPHVFGMRFKQIENKSAFATLRAARAVALSVGARKKHAEKKATEVAKP